MIGKLKNPFFLKIFLLTKLPLALFGGLKLIKLDDKTCITSMPYGWRTKNPFKSMYFAAQSMAAEFSTALLAANSIKKSGKNIALLIVNMKAEFSKKASSKVIFTCNDGEKYKDGIMKCVESGETVSIEGRAEGVDSYGDIVSVFYFTWSFKERK